MTRLCGDAREQAMVDFKARLSAVTPIADKGGLIAGFHSSPIEPMRLCLLCSATHADQR
jgi:hypothetical protein